MGPDFWNSEKSEILLNPRLTSAEADVLRGLSQKFSLPSHVWLASSGSTTERDSSVKLIALSKPAILSSATAVNRHLEVTSTDRWVQVLPHFHVGGLGIEARAFLAGQRVFSGLQNGTWDAVYFREVCERNQITLAALVPAQVFDLVKANLPCPHSIRAVVVGGGGLKASLGEQAARLGWPVLPSFGMTETSSQIATALPGSSEMTVLPHLQIKVDDEHILSIRGPSLLTGYAQRRGSENFWSDPKDTQGWLKTRDRVQLIGSTLKPLGRVDDYIKILGEGVNLAVLLEKLEDICSRAGILSSAVTLSHQTSERSGQELVLVFEEQVSESQRHQIQTLFNASVLPFERVWQTRAVSKIPRSELQKVLRSQL